MLYHTLSLIENYHSKLYVVVKVNNHLEVHIHVESIEGDGQVCFESVARI